MSSNVPPRHLQGVYLIHLDRPMPNSLRQTQHYLGWASDVEARVVRHWSGDGAKMLRAAREQGICWELVRVWPNAPRLIEALLKRKRNGRRICPVCSPKGRLGTFTYITEELWPCKGLTATQLSTYANCPF